MPIPLDRVTRQFLDEHATHALLWETLQGVVPHWSARLKRRWIRDFLPHWRTDLMEVARQRRYLQLAMRRGWFDEAASARRWVTFIGLLDAHPGAAPPTSTVNLFNLVAALPEVPEVLALGESQRRLLHGPGVLDAEQLTGCVVELMQNPSGGERVEVDPMQHLYHVREGRALTQEGRAWLEIDWAHQGLQALVLLEPFGTEPWHMVSELGLDEQGKLVPYHRIENLSAEIVPGVDRALHFDGQTRHHEPEGLRQPDARPSATPGVIAQTFAIGHGMRAGITARGALAIFLAPGEA